MAAAPLPPMPTTISGNLWQWIKADGGLDIGLTLIGMHLKRVAVPVHLTHNRVGEAIVTGARTRPPLIGGERARYKKDDNRGAF